MTMCNPGPDLRLGRVKKKKKKTTVIREFLEKLANE